MASRYEIFCQVLEAGSFTRAAEKLNYSQSAISQGIKALERELGTALLSRGKDGIRLTADGRQLLPYIQSVCQAERALRQKRGEMLGLEHAVVTIGTFTSISRNILPPLMQAFKARHPHVRFVLSQGEYTSIAQWIQEGRVDFGFVNSGAVKGLTVRVLYRDQMSAVLPAGHPLAALETLSLRQLAQEPLILLDEGGHSVSLDAFSAQGLTPRIEYTVYDDYSILAMVRQNLGVSLMYNLVLKGFEEGLAVRPVAERPERTVALAWRNWDAIPLAARLFAQFVMERAAPPE